MRAHFWRVDNRTWSKKRGGAGEGVREGKGGEGEGREKRADGGTAVKGRVGVVSSFGVGSLPTGRNA